MKIAIISDTHDNLMNLEKAIIWIKKQKIKLILHCGDINSREMIKDIKERFHGEVKFVKGNADSDLIELPEMVETEIDGKKIAFCHKPDLAKKLAQSGNPSTGSEKAYDLVFYGHTHRPWEEKIGNTRLINPGELAGQFYKPTFAIYDTKTDKLELKILEKI